MESSRSFKPKILLTLSYMLLVLVTSVIPMDREIRGFQFLIDLKPTVQNLLHIPVYAILSILFLQVTKNYQLEGWKKIALVFICAGGFGVLNEVVQIFIPGRYAGLTDMGLNFIGAILGVFIYTSVEKSKLDMIRRIICG